MQRFFFIAVIYLLSWSVYAQDNKPEKVITPVIEVKKPEKLSQQKLELLVSQIRKKILASRSKLDRAKPLIADLKKMENLPETVLIKASSILLREIEKVCKETEADLKGLLKEVAKVEGPLQNMKADLKRGFDLEADKQLKALLRAQYESCDKGLMRLSKEKDRLKNGTDEMTKLIERFSSQQRRFDQLQSFPVGIDYMIQELEVLNDQVDLFLVQANSMAGA